METEVTKKINTRIVYFWKEKLQAVNIGLYYRHIWLVYKLKTNYV